MRDRNGVGMDGREGGEEGKLIGMYYMKNIPFQYKKNNFKTVKKRCNHNFFSIRIPADIRKQCK